MYMVGCQFLSTGSRYIAAALLVHHLDFMLPLFEPHLLVYVFALNSRGCREIVLSLQFSLLYYQQEATDMKTTLN